MERPSASVVLAATSTICLILLSAELVFAQDLKQYFSEGMGAERLTAVLLALAVFFWLWIKGDAALPHQWYVPVVLMLMVMRELDFDKRFSDHGLLKLSTLTGPAPLGARLASVVLVGLILTILWQLVRRDLRPWLRDLRAGMPAAWLMLAAIGTLCIAKSLDGIARKLAPWGVEVSADIGLRAGRIEEMLEMGFAILMIQAIAMSRPQRQATMAMASPAE